MSIQALLRCDKGSCRCLAECNVPGPLRELITSRVAFARGGGDGLITRSVSDEAELQGDGCVRRDVVLAGYYNGSIKYIFMSHELEHFKPDYHPRRTTRLLSDVK